MSILEVKNIEKRFGGTEILKNIKDPEQLKALTEQLLQGWAFSFSAAQNTV